MWRDLCLLPWRSGASHCPPRPQTPLSINQLACVSAALFDSREICLHQSFSSVLGRKVPPRNHCTNWPTTPRTGTACSSPLTSQAPFIQLITTFLPPRTSKRRCVSDGHATYSRDRCHHVVFLNVPQGDRKHSKTQVVSSSAWSAKCTQTLSSVRATQSTCCKPSVSVSRRLPRIAWKVVPSRSVCMGKGISTARCSDNPPWTVWFCRPSTFRRSACHRLFPVSASLRIARTTHHQPCCNTHTPHRQRLHAWLIVLIQLPSYNDTSAFHVINPALVWSPAQAQDTTKLHQFPNAQCLEHWLCVGPFTRTMERGWYTRRVEGVNTFFWLAIWDCRTKPSSRGTWSWLWRFCATYWPPSNLDGCFSGTRFIFTPCTQRKVPRVTLSIIELGQTCPNHTSAVWGVPYAVIITDGSFDF